MISEKLSVTVAGAAVTTIQGGPRGSSPASSLAAVAADVLVVAEAPLAVLLGCAPARRPSCRPPRPEGSGAPGYAQPLPAPRSATSGTAASGTKSSSSTKSSGPLAFLDDSKLSADEKIFRLALYMTDKADKELEKKLDEISGKEKGKSTSSGSPSTGASASGSAGSGGASGGGLLGGLLGGSGAGGLLGGLLGGGGGGGAGGLLGGLIGAGGGLLGSLMGGGSAGGLPGLGGGGGDLLGQVFSAVGMGLDFLEQSGVVDLVSQLSGPVLAAGATVCGFPEAAPLLMQAAPALTSGAFSAVQGATHGASSLLGSGDGGGGSFLTGGSSSSSGTGSAKASSSSGTSGSAKSSGASGSSESSGEAGDVDKKDLLELEHMQQKQQQMFSLLSNLMKGMHDTRMAVIGNIRA